MLSQSFDKAFLDKQKKALEKEKKRLEEELNSRSKAKKYDASDYKATYQDYGDDKESNAAEYAQTETNIGVVEQLEDELVRVNAALKRIEEGKYGFDVNTGELIDRERLEACPAAEERIEKQ